MIKPDGVKKGLTGEIVSRFEDRGLNTLAIQKKSMSNDEAEELYSIHKGKPFYEPLVEYITSGPVVLIVLEGDEVIKMVRDMMGATNPKEAAPGTIRGDFAVDISQNIIHGSDSEESARKEIGIFFPDL